MSRTPRQILGTVLVVDDEPLNRDLLRRALGHDYKVEEAEDAADAVRRLGDLAVDIVICDHLMPGRSGSELARDIRGRWPSVVCILLTGYPDAPEVEEALSEGVIFAIMGKPIVITELRDLVSRAMGSRGMLRGP